MTGAAARWYIELPTVSIENYKILASAFLVHFQLPIPYDTETKLLTSLRQDTSTHISDHIHEWRCRRRLIKAPIPDQFFEDWFVKSLFPTIAKDVSLSGAVPEEQVLLRAQHLDLVYSQSGILYDIFPNAPQSWQELPRPSPGPHAEGIVGSVVNSFVGQVVSQIG